MAEETKVAAEVPCRNCGKTQPEHAAFDEEGLMCPPSERYEPAIITGTGIIATEVKSTCGRGISFENDEGDKCEIHAFSMDRGGVFVCFKRNGREYPLNLSERGAVALVSVLQALFWAAPRTPTPVADAEDVGGAGHFLRPGPP